MVYLGFFLMNISSLLLSKFQLKKEKFEIYWQKYLSIIEQIAFKELKMHKILIAIYFQDISLLIMEFME